MKIMFKFRALLLIVIAAAVAFCFPSLVFATEQDGSITLSSPVENGKFYIYRIGVISGSGVAPAESFSQYSVDLTSKTAAQTFASYIKRDSVKPLKKAITDSNNKVKFDNLSDGVYLILGDRIKSGKKIYEFQPSIISLPNYSEGTANRQIKAESKYEVNTDNKKTIDVSVLKVWSADSSQNRPESVAVQLLKDGKVYKTVQLNKANSWKYVWKNLDCDSEWLVTEKSVPDGYKVSIDKDKTAVFTITNSGDYTPPTSTTVTTVPPTPTDPSSPGDPPEKIPQTGQLWWPVTVFGILGAFFVIIGAGLKRNS